QAEEPWSVPSSAGDCQGDLRQARIGLAVPGKAVGEHRHPLHLPVPFATHHRPGPEVRGALALLHGSLAGFLRRSRAVEQGPALGIKVNPVVGLELVGQNTKYEVAGQMRRRLAAVYGMPASLKGSNIEIAQARDLDVDRFPVRHSRTDVHTRHRS